MISPYAQLDDFLEFCEESFDKYKEAVAEEATDSDRIIRSVLYSDTVISTIESMINMYKKNSSADILVDILKE